MIDAAAPMPHEKRRENNTQGSESESVVLIDMEEGNNKLNLINQN
jgi:hypothetical protein